MEADPGRLRRLAAAVREDAVRVRGTARRLAGLCDVRWHSPAGSLFRDRVEGRVRGLQATAVRLDHAADLLDEHARHVEAALAAMTGAAATAQRTVDEVWAGLHGRAVRGGG